MGSSCEANGPSIDTKVGGLVWVRRRNGSWWPGQIMGLDKVPLVSPRRPGTPVKLLGREDISVDWYNLEKSKRVKAFRCGEYDECIEKAKSTANLSSKKVERYARREDAILHALEIEKSQLSKSNNDELSGLDFISVSLKRLSRTAATADNSLEGITQQTTNDSEDDGTEGSKKRMRGLQDIGVGRAVSSFKKKRTQVVHVYDFLKKKNRRHQLTKVLKKTEMVTIPVTCEENTGPNEPGLSKYNELKVSFPDSTGDITDNTNANNCKQKEHESSSNSESLETDDSDGRLFDVPFVREEKQTTGSSPVSVPETCQIGTSLVETISVGPNEFQESGSVISGANISHIIDNNGTSKWQHKRKRNKRNKRKTKTMQNFLTPDDESREVNNTVELSGPQKRMFVNLSCSTVNPKYKPSDLYDVNIEVQCHFPMDLSFVSLSSNFIGQPVTGHSVVVEVFSDAVSDHSLNSSECLSSSCELGGVNKVNGNVEMVLEASKKVRKNGHLSNKKIRKLSSLTGSKRPSETRVLTRPDLACVPLKVVFGRINAALGITCADESLTR